MNTNKVIDYNLKNLASIILVALILFILLLCPSYDVDGELRQFFTDRENSFYHYISDFTGERYDSVNHVYFDPVEESQNQIRELQRKDGSQSEKALALLSIACIQCDLDIYYISSILLSFISFTFVLGFLGIYLTKSNKNTNIKILDYVNILLVISLITIVILFIAVSISVGLVNKEIQSFTQSAGMSGKIISISGITIMIFLFLYFLVFLYNTRIISKNILYLSNHPEYDDPILNNIEKEKKSNNEKSIELNEIPISEGKEITTSVTSQKKIELESVQSTQIPKVVQAPKPECKKVNVTSDGFVILKDKNGKEIYYDQYGNKGYKDKYGDLFIIDEHGYAAYYSTDGNIYYKDENGIPFYIDENGVSKYFD